MKNLIAVLVVFLAAAVAVAGTYSITTSAAQDQRLEKQRVRLNKTSCQAVGLPNSCTQSQCRVTNPNCEIYSDIADLLDRNVIKNYTEGLKENDKRDDQAQAQAAWDAANAAGKTAMCASFGLPAGCEIFPR